jgi:N-acetylneuraminate synthase/N,N'-diacetyllegionaminate synthase
MDHYRSKKMSAFIIAEIGINHNGSVKIAKNMIDKAKEADADAVKFQTFKAEEFVSNKKQTYTYRSCGVEVTESMFEMFKRHEFNKEDWIEIIEYCREKDIAFSSTAQNLSDLEFLLSITDLPFLKIGSDDLTNLENIKLYASKNIPMIISAGMSYANEIEDAVSAIKETGNKDITVLHCTSSYPTDADEVNLKKIPVIRDAFDVKVGFSDHTIGSVGAIGAIILGATVIEKHFTLDNNMEGPDHWFSINPEELKKYVSDIRFIEQALGKGTLQPTKKESEIRKIARRRIVTSRDISKNEILQSSDFTFKRVEEKDFDDGVSPKDLKFLINRKFKRDVKKNETVTLELF